MRTTLLAVLSLSLAANVVLVARLVLEPAAAAPSRRHDPVPAEAAAQAPHAPAPSPASTDPGTPSVPATAAAPQGDGDSRREALLHEIAERREDLSLIESIEPRRRAFLLARDLRQRLVALLALPTAERSAALDRVVEYLGPDEWEQAAALLADEADPALLGVLGEMFLRCRGQELEISDPLGVLALVDTGRPLERRVAAAAAMVCVARYDTPGLDARLCNVLSRASDPAIATALVRALKSFHGESLPEQLRPAVAGTLDRLLPGEVRRDAFFWIFQSSSEPAFDPLEPYRRWQGTSAEDVRADVAWAMARLRVDSFDYGHWGDDEEKALARRDEAWRGFLGVYEATADASLRDDLFLAAMGGLSLIHLEDTDDSVPAALRELAARESDPPRAARHRRIAKDVEEGTLLYDDPEIEALRRERGE